MSLQRESLNLIYKQTEIQPNKLYASYANEVDVKNQISHGAKRNEIHRVG